MNVEIRDTPFHVSLVGVFGTIDGKCVGEVGRRLMDRMWEEIRARGIKSTGINHWVYLPRSQLFTGVVLAEAIDDLGSLDTLEVSLGRHLHCVHKGPYSELPEIWKQLTAQLNEQGEITAFPNLEIYGHCQSDPAACETTILIGLLSAPSGPNRSANRSGQSGEI